MKTVREIATPLEFEIVISQDNNILDFIKTKGRVIRNQVQKEFGYSVSGSDRILDRLTREGHITKQICLVKLSNDQARKMNVFEMVS